MLNYSLTTFYGGIIELKSLRLIISIACLITTLFSPLWAYAEHAHKVELAYGEFRSQSYPMTINIPSKLKLEVINDEGSAATLIYNVYQIKSYTCTNEEGIEERIQYSEPMMHGVLHMGESSTVDKEVQPGKYYVELSTALWLPAFNKPTCKGEARLISLP